jgi:dolichyl-phosphate-mannose-protein mannosyltransferase
MNLYRNRGLMPPSEVVFWHDIADVGQQSVPSGGRLCRLLFGGLLLVYLFFFFWHSSHNLLSGDELLSLNTAEVSTAKKLISVQMTSPVSLDPPLYHLLAHVALLLPINSDLAVRLPSGAGYLVLLLASYGIMKRLAGPRVALLYIALLEASPVLYYATDARPYGLLLGMSAASLYCWQSAIHRQRSRRWALPCLLLTLSAAINCHYYGLLVISPIVGAECYRSCRKQTIDWPMSMAILVGTCSVVAWLPFLKAASEYKAHYYLRLHLSQALYAYRDIMTVLPQYHWMASISSKALFTLAILGAYRILSEIVIKRSPHSYDWCAICLFSLLPIVGLFLSYLSGGGMESRFVAEAAIGLYAMVTFTIRNALDSRIGLITIVLLLTSLFTTKAWQAEREAKQSERELSYYVTLERFPHGKILISDLGGLLGLEHYVVDPALGSRFESVYDTSAEIKSGNGDLLSRTSIALGRFTSLPIQDYADFSEANGEYTLVCWKKFACWLPSFLSDKGKSLKLIDQNGMWTIYSVSNLNSAVPSATLPQAPR